MLRFVKCERGAIIISVNSVCWHSLTTIGRTAATPATTVRDIFHTGGLVSCNEITRESKRSNMSSSLRTMGSRVMTMRAVGSITRRHRHWDITPISRVFQKTQQQIMHPHYCCFSTTSFTNTVEIHQVIATDHKKDTNKNVNQDGSEKVKIAACGDVDEDDDDEMEQEEMFIEPHACMGTDRIEWGGPTRGGRLMEPTRFGDWERKGRCSDF